MKPLYFDYNATSPVLPEVFSAMEPYFKEHFGNPSSGHAWGLPAKKAVAKAREQVSGLIGCAKDEIVFTSCATESINTVLKGLLGRGPGAHLVTSVIEHPATLECAGFLERHGVEVTYVGVDANGLVNPREVAQACRAETKLVSIMLANNETGAIQPVADVASLLKGRGILIHTDAAQAVGKIPVNVEELGIDFLTVAGHKLYSPKGVGALYVRNKERLRPLLLGGGQEFGLRSGTENVALMAGLGQACALASNDLRVEIKRQEDMGKRFLKGMDRLRCDYVLHSKDAPRLPQTMFIGFRDLKATDLLSGLVGRDVAVSGGAACHGEETTLSHVLAAMGAEPAYAEGTLRISWGRPTRLDHIDELVNRMGLVLAELKG